MRMVSALAARVRAFSRDLAAPPSGPRFRPVVEIVVPLLLAGVLTWGATASGFDYGAEWWIYHIGGNTWAIGDHPFWSLLYKAGTFPATVVVFVALALLAVSWKTARLQRWRRVLVFVILSGLIGPGVITNGILKEYWGRPRPRELVDFGGRSAFEPALTIDPTSHGMSFPSGHSTMGFYFLAFYFLLRRHKPGMAQGVLFLSLSAGGLMGLARMTQGAHFFTDVLWAGVVCWFVPMALYHAMGLDRSLVSERKGAGRAMPRWVKLSIAAAAVAVVAGVLLATPYSEKRTLTLRNRFAEEGPLRLSLLFAQGQVEIVPGEQYRVTNSANGHGVPTSNIDLNELERQEQDGASFVVYTERVSGWFRELNSTTRVEVPWHRLQHLSVDVGEAEVRIELGEDAVEGLVIHLYKGKGNVVLERGGIPVRTTPNGDARIEGGGGDTGAPREVSLGDEFKGRLRVSPPASPMGQ